MTDTNEQIYFNRATVHHYASYSEQLQLPEKTILEILVSELSAMKMLDMGVGGGRTTPHFARRVKEYTAADFSEGMIRVCCTKWQKEFATAKFEVCDVRDLTRFEDGYFDFVLFSFNGLDNITTEERKGALAGIHRITRSGGYFCFSSHNLLYLPTFFSVNFRFHPVKFLKGLLGRKKLLRNNREAIKRLHNADQLVIFDDVYDLGLHTCYIRPGVQIEQLKNAGFENTRLFDLSGKEKTIQESDSIKDAWVYYLCRKF